MRPFATSCSVAFAALFSLASLAGLAALPPLAAGCAPMKGGSTPTSSLPRYAGDIVDLFDDVIDPHAVGLELEGRADPKSDPKVRSRAQAADAVVRGRVTTVTGEVEGPDKAYLVGFKTVERLAGPPRTGGSEIGDEFVVHVDKNSPALGILNSFEGRLVGKTFVVEVKAFSRMDGERELHFHADVDAPDVVAAVKEAVILDQVK